MSAATVDVRFEGVWKQYRLGTRRGATDFWALKNISFDVTRGSSVGIIGRNGAGKSTLLKLLASITAPTRGRIEIAGRVSALIEVGSGFHPELSGRENVFLSGAILGMRRREIASKLDDIVRFAGVEAFIDTPVKWYSSGMYVRLGFAIAAHMEPEVLLVDEVLAVGDAEFQVKCLRRIQELRGAGTTIVFISHDLTAVQQLCDRAVLLERGEIVAAGDPAEVVSQYHRTLVSSDLERSPAESVDGSIKVASLAFRDPDSGRPIAFRTGRPLTVEVRYDASRVLDDVVFEVAYYSADGRTTIASASTAAEASPLTIAPPGGRVEFTCASLPFQPGAYYVGAVVRDRRTGHVLDWWDGGTMLYVEPGSVGGGQFYVPHTWRIVHGQEPPAHFASRRVRP
jgi:ABC-type polysaccharide/polyol phosphate transport system ATPase subunit